MNSILLLAASLLTSAPWQTFTAKDGDKPWTYTAKDEDIAKGGWVFLQTQLKTTHLWLVHSTAWAKLTQ